MTTRKSQPKLTGKTHNQFLLIDAINKAGTIVVTGPAGTGKTFVASSKAAEMFQEGKVTKIVLTRPTVPTGRSLGFFPGSLEEKMAPWVIPVIEVLKRVLGDEAVECNFKKGNIEIVPFETIRGRTFDDAFVILDEAQNATLGELKAFLTRQGENSTVLINGDTSQTDLRGSSGLQSLVNIIKSSLQLSMAVPVIQFSKLDVVRSGMCQLWVEEFERYENIDDKLPSFISDQPKEV
jgi:phosphate starvation-inducible PhoH-like protein